tara:strand:+ start:860 stop:1192 length:333 start_codon:yes stop_codon:yes gene_type:complete
MNKISDLLTVKAAAKVMNCCTNSIYTWAKEGKKSSNGEMIRLETIRPHGSRDIFTTPSMIQRFLSETFPTRQNEKFVNTLDVLEKQWGIDTTQARSAMTSAPLISETPAL